MKNIIFSGIQPSGELHIGNYIGAIQQWTELAKKNETYFCIVDLHSITIPQDPKELRRRIREVAAIYIAAGINPKKSTVFVQSEVPAHAELGWMLSTLTRVGELERMTQYKDKAKKFGKTGIPTGLLAYPPLMAADVLLYGTTIVPVGEDQAQHVELTRTIARRFNKTFGELFIVPKVAIRKMGGLIMGLDDASKKMSKSASNPNNYIALTDDEATIRRKVMRAVTDSGSEILYDLDGKPAISNLLTIFHFMTGRDIGKIALDYQDVGYAKFKTDLADAVIKHLEPFQKKLFTLLRDEEKLDAILVDGAARADKVAQKTLVKAKQLMGLGL
jgi:tryptophanyl-tRNA synthetase